MIHKGFISTHISINLLLRKGVSCSFNISRANSSFKKLSIPEMKYESTRGNDRNRTFKEVVLEGLARDGGLFVPTEFPKINISQLPKLPQCTEQEISEKNYEWFREVAEIVIAPFVKNEGNDQDFSDDQLRSLLQKSFHKDNFESSVVTPLVSKQYQNEELLVLELFHGPTYAFKDVALQFLGNLFDFLLQSRSVQMSEEKCKKNAITVVGATSGDTGSAAIHGLRAKSNVQVFILHPFNKVSAFQRLQMITVLDSNIQNIAINGTFDEAQNIVKELFEDLEFRDKHNLAAINSINWARILIQIVYYFIAYLQYLSLKNVNEEYPKISFSVPTGNFGDILAGWYAKKLGLPIDKLIVATNQNDILHRLFSQGNYHKTAVLPSYSPSMDIQISSNLERYLYEVSGYQGERLCEWMQTFKETGKLTISGKELEKIQNDFVSVSVTEEQTIGTMQEIYEKYHYFIDPHTAIGVYAMKTYKQSHSSPVICLSTAHACKFEDAAKRAGFQVPVPPKVANLDKLPTRCHYIETPTAASVKALVERSSIFCQ